MSAAPIAVIGAGAAGLLAALELATRGVAVDVYGPAGRGPVASAGRWLAAAPLDGAAGDRAEEDAHVADAVAASGGTAASPSTAARTAGSRARVVPGTTRRA